MNSTLRYVPPIKGSFYLLVLISYFPVVLALYVLFVKVGILVIILFTLLYAGFMIFVFISLSKSHYIELDQAKNAIIVHRTFKSIEINLDIIQEIELEETKRSYLLTITTNDQTNNYSLSGSLSFEEPAFIPFLEKLKEFKPIIKLGPFSEAVLHGSNKFNPWSSKMYYAYWTYIIILVVYYLSLLLFINILK